VWTGFIWLRIGTSGRLPWPWLWTFWFHKMLEISWHPEQLLASQEELCSMELTDSYSFIHMAYAYSLKLLSWHWTPPYSIFSFRGTENGNDVPVFLVTLIWHHLPQTCYRICFIHAY
jgi:hypothetical protein